MTQGPLSADDIRRLFSELASELDAAGQRAEVFLVGGAAIAVCFDSRRATRDLDAVFAPTDSVRRAAAAVADREGLDPDWLNDAVGYHTVEEGLALVERSYPGRPIAARVQFLLEEIVQSLDSD
jgi:hypothetical protein